LRLKAVVEKASHIPLIGLFDDLMVVKGTQLEAAHAHDRSNRFDFRRHEHRLGDDGSATGIISWDLRVT
jgi:hypothetical protein